MDPREDPVVEEVREARRRASAECGHDPAKLVEYYMRLQEQYADRLLDEPARGDTGRQGQDAA